MIATAQGEKPIEDIKPGDRVFSTDPEDGDGKPHLETVSRIFVREAEAVVDIRLGDQIITATPNHPFWVPEKGWTAAGDLASSMSLLTKDGDIVYIDSVIVRPGSFTVYNFEVASAHTYYVSQLGILVHNDCGETLKRFGKSPESASRLGKKAAEAERNGLPHGVSTTAGDTSIPSSSAPRSAVEDAFKVHDTPTRNDPLHKTVELPNPVTKEVADLFNRIFGRR